MATDANARIESLAAFRQTALAAVAGKVDYAAPTHIRIAVAGGASIVLEGGNITVTAAGKMEVPDDVWKDIARTAR